MAGEGEKAYGILADHRLGRLGLQVKLDKGFEQGSYCVYVEYDDLAARMGFATGHQSAREYCALLKAQLGRLPGYGLGETEDASQSGDPRRKRDLEATFLSFPIETNDGRFHDDEIKEQFRVASLRTGQVWDQARASEQTHRRQTRQEKFRRQLGALLNGEVYAGLDATVKDRLLDEIPALAFPPRGRDL